MKLSKILGCFKKSSKNSGVDTPQENKESKNNVRDEQQHGQSPKVEADCENSKSCVNDQSLIDDDHNRSKTSVKSHNLEDQVENSQEADQHDKSLKTEVDDEQIEYLKKNFEMKDGKLAKMTTIGQILVGNDQVIEEEYVKDNLVDNIDGLKESQGESPNHKYFDSCPNFYEGKDGDNYSEKFQTKKSIKISLDPNDKNPLTINHNDLKNYASSNTAGAFGSISQRSGAEK